MLKEWRRETIRKMFSTKTFVTVKKELLEKYSSIKKGWYLSQDFYMDEGILFKWYIKYFLKNDIIKRGKDCDSLILAHGHWTGLMQIVHTMKSLLNSTKLLIQYLRFFSLPFVLLIRLRTKVDFIIKS